MANDGLCNIRSPGKLCWLVPIIGFISQGWPPAPPPPFFNVAAYNSKAPQPGSLINSLPPLPKCHMWIFFFPFSQVKNHYCFFSLHFFTKGFMWLCESVRQWTGHSHRWSAVCTLKQDISIFPFFCCEFKAHPDIISGSIPISTLGTEKLR